MFSGTQTPEPLRAPPGVSVWAESSGRRRPSLPGSVEADVAIVGAGFTGLWAAYYLLKQDPLLRVVVLEREHVGFGASGRNGGWCSAIFPVSLGRVEKLYSRTAALDLQRAMNETVTEIGRVTEAEGIDCDFDHHGFVSLARSPAQLARAQAIVDGARRFGLGSQWELLTAGEAREKINARGVLGGSYTPHCALLNPGKLVRGLAAWVEEHGGTIYEDTEAADIDQGQVRTARGTVTASTVIRATEGYTPSFARYRRDIAPLYSLVVATAPLSDSLREELGLNRRLAFNDARNLRIYARPTRDGRLVFGGRGAPYHLGSKVTPAFDTSATIHKKIAHTLREFFPQLAVVPLTHRWGGPLGVPRDWFPSVGISPDRRTAWAGPYVGDGVTISNLAGRILRNLITDRADELNALPITGHASPRWEVEPFRWIGVNAGLAAATAADLEERLTNRPSTIAALLERTTGAH